jgi:hypothetical protein
VHSLNGCVGYFRGWRVKKLLLLLLLMPAMAPAQITNSNLPNGNPAYQLARPLMVPQICTMLGVCYTPGGGSGGVTPTGSLTAGCLPIWVNISTFTIGSSVLCYTEVQTSPVPYYGFGAAGTALNWHFDNYAGPTDQLPFPINLSIGGGGGGAVDLAQIEIGANDGSPTVNLNGDVAFRATSALVNGPAAYVEAPNTGGWNQTGGVFAVEVQSTVNGNAGVYLVANPFFGAHCGDSPPWPGCVGGFGSSVYSYTGLFNSGSTNGLENCVICDAYTSGYPTKTYFHYITNDQQSVGYPCPNADSYGGFTMCNVPIPATFSAVGAGSGGSISPALCVGGSVCDSRGGLVTWTTGVGATAVSVDMALNTTAPNPLNCTVSSFGSTPVASGLAGMSATGFIYVSAATPADNTTYEFSYVCSPEP